MTAALLLLALPVLAAPPAESRWQELEPRTGDRGALGDEGPVRIVDAHGPDPLRAVCPEGVVPSRRAIYDGALVEGSFSTPVRDESSHVFPPGPDSAWEWLVTPASCDLYRLDRRATPEGLARLEWVARAADLPGLVEAAAPFEPEEQAWVEAADTRARYATLRPGGPHPAVTSHPVPGGGRARSLDPFERRGDADRWWLVEGAATWRVGGPRRVRVHARWLDAPRLLCLAVDGEPSCQDRTAWRETVVRAGALADAPATLEGRALSHRATWSVLLPGGVHDLRLEGPALVRATAAWPHLYDGSDAAPASTVVHPPPPVLEEQRETVHPVGNPASVMLMGPSVLPVRPEHVRWVPLDAPRATGAERVDEPGLLTLHLQGPPEGICTVRFPTGDTWRGQPTEALHRFAWTGEGEAEGLPAVEGCTARIRMTGLRGPLHDPWIAQRWWRVDPGGVIAWRPAGPEPTLWVRHPAEQATPYTLQVDHPDGSRDTWTIDPRAAAPDRHTPDHQAWQPALRIPVRPGEGRLTVQATAPLAARASVATTDPPARARSGVVPEAPGDGEPGADDDLRAASRRVAGAPDDDARVGALLQRAAVLAGLGEPRLAWLDWERAALLAPARAEDNPLSAALQRHNARATWGPDRWAPTDPRWVPAAAPVLAARRAARGDPLAVAHLLRSADLDPRPWWRDALRVGQIPTAEERQHAYVDLVRHAAPDDVDAPWWWPLRVPSTWERIHQVTGRVHRGRFDWPADPPPPVDLFPDPWPADATQRLPSGWELALPRSGGARDLPVRCRSTRVDPPESCRFVVRTATGRVLAATRVDPWGTPDTLAVPASGGAAYVGVEPAQGVEAQVRLAGDLDRTRAAWATPGGGYADFVVLGPTVIDLQAWSPRGSNTLTVEVRTREGTRRSVHEVGPVARPRVAIPEAGPARVRVRPTRLLRFVPSMRVPIDASRPARGDRAAIADALSTAPPVPPPPDPPPPPPWSPPTGRPPAGPPLLLIARSGLGNATLDQSSAEPSLLEGLRAVQSLTLASHPRRWPLWLEGGVRADASPSGALLGGSSAVEWRAVDRGWRLWLLGRGEIVRAPDPDAPMTSARLDLRLTADTRPWRAWQLLGRLRFRQHLVLAGHWDPIAHGDDRLRLWSLYRQRHPFGLEPRAEIRWRPGPWGRVSLFGGGDTNAILHTFDYALAGASWDWSHPGVHTRLGALVERRFADQDRAEGYWSPRLYADADATWWPTRDLGIQIAGGAAWRPRFGEVTGLVELRLYASRDRALTDLRPSRTAARHAWEWYQDPAAERRRLHSEEPGDLDDHDP